MEVLGTLGMLFRPLGMLLGWLFRELKLSGWPLSIIRVLVTGPVLAAVVIGTYWLCEKIWPKRGDVDRAEIGRSASSD